MICFSLFEPKLFNHSFSLVSCCAWLYVSQCYAFGGNCTNAIFRLLVSIWCVVDQAGAWLRIVLGYQALGELNPFLRAEILRQGRTNLSVSTDVSARIHVRPDMFHQVCAA